ncbi:hypothetical protein IOQ59_10965 [Pontibacterium sp. N1Y112]|uniref:Uncharacterized protein n=1 Tax=Pontibacterium sinense TaxID=2781979 RepID=A0A8J7FHI9_9GAMM|nr:hypothetical protein [Pontibacterium sinense]MBE9397778.1 hypothetical protein [Pontibacterium sinense]
MAGKRGAGRPALDPLEKFRRKVKRAELKLQSMKTLADLETESGPIDLPKRRGRVPMNAQQKLQKEQVKFNKLIAELRKREDEAGEAHCNLEAVEDPTVNELGLSTTGKPRSDIFTILDRKLKAAKKKVKEAEEMEEVRNVKGGMGRPKITKAERVRRAKIEAFTLEARILEEEGRLDEIGLQKRKLKKLRDAAHDARMRIKAYTKEDYELCFDEINRAKQLLESIENTVKTEELRFKHLEDMKEGLNEYDDLENELRGIAEYDPNLPACEHARMIQVLRKQKIIKDELNRIRNELNATVHIDGF